MKIKYINPNSNSDADNRANTVSNLIAEVEKKYAHQTCRRGFEQTELLHKMHKDIVDALTPHYPYKREALLGLVEVVWFRTSCNSFTDDLVFILEQAFMLNRSM